MGSNRTEQGAIMGETAFVDSIFILAESAGITSNQDTAAPETKPHAIPESSFFNKPNHSVPGH
jgi:hypothetical protein